MSKYDGYSPIDISGGHEIKISTYDESELNEAKEMQDSANNRAQEIWDELRRLFSKDGETPADLEILFEKRVPEANKIGSPQEKETSRVIQVKQADEQLSWYDETGENKDDDEEDDDDLKIHNPLLEQVNFTDVLSLSPEQIKAINELSSFEEVVQTSKGKDFEAIIGKYGSDGLALLLMLVGISGSKSVYTEHAKEEFFVPGIPTFVEFFNNPNKEKKFGLLERHVAGDFTSVSTLRSVSSVFIAKYNDRIDELFALFNEIVSPFCQVPEGVEIFNLENSIRGNSNLAFNDAVLWPRKNPQLVLQILIKENDIPNLYQLRKRPKNNSFELVKVVFSRSGESLEKEEQVIATVEGSSLELLREGLVTEIDGLTDYQRELEEYKNRKIKDRNRNLSRKEVHIHESSDLNIYLEDPARLVPLASQDDFLVTIGNGSVFFGEERNDYGMSDTDHIRVRKSELNNLAYLLNRYKQEYSLSDEQQVRIRCLGRGKSAIAYMISHKDPDTDDEKLHVFKVFGYGQDFVAGITQKSSEQLENSFKITKLIAGLDNNDFGVTRIETDSNLPLIEQELIPPCEQTLLKDIDPRIAREMARILFISSFLYSMPDFAYTHPVSKVIAEIDGKTITFDQMEEMELQFSQLMQGNISLVTDEIDQSQLKFLDLDFIFSPETKKNYLLLIKSLARELGKFFKSGGDSIKISALIEARNKFVLENEGNFNDTDYPDFDRKFYGNLGTLSVDEDGNFDRSSEIGEFGDLQGKGLVNYSLLLFNTFKMLAEKSDETRITEDDMVGWIDDFIKRMGES